MLRGKFTLVLTRLPSTRMQVREDYSMRVLSPTISKDEDFRAFQAKYKITDDWIRMQIQSKLFLSAYNKINDHSDGSVLTWPRANLRDFESVTLIVRWRMDNDKDLLDFDAGCRMLLKVIKQLGKVRGRHKNRVVRKLLQRNEHENG